MQQKPPTDPGSAKPVQPQTGLVTLLFTDIVSSTSLKQHLGDKAGAALIQQHHALVRQFLGTCPGAEEIETAGDSFLLSFLKPSDAVRFALVLQGRLRLLNQGQVIPLRDRMGIHLGEVVIEKHEVGHKPKDLYGIQIDTCSRVMSLAKADQVLMSRGVFDSARQMLKGEDVADVGPLEWLNHGSYLLKGLGEPIEICEVREAGQEQAPGPPTSSEKAQRQVRPDEEPVLGWRPAVGQVVPNTRWLLEKKLGEGGFGEVWLGRQQATKEHRVFKFCFEGERVRFLKRELTLFRVLKERVGDHPNIVRLHDVYLEQPPFYMEMDYVEGKDLRSWSEEHGGIKAIPLETRLEIVAQAAEALQAAHDAGIIHRDVKPANILIGGKGPGATEVRVKLTDFGIGQVVSEEYLKGITRAGFTQTLMGESSSSHTGTQLYMAPELLAGKPASTRSDIYSLGVVLYQVLVGDFTRPVTTDWAADIEDQLLREDLKHCFAGKAEERFAGAGLLARHIRQVPERRAEVARRQVEQAERDRLHRQAAQRQKIVVVSAGVTVMFLLLAIALGYGLRQARAAKASEARLRKVAESRAYAADMKAAQVAIEQNSRGQAARLLARYRAKPGEEDLRGVEWRYLWKRLRGDELDTWQRPGMVDWLRCTPDGLHVLSSEVNHKVQVLESTTGRVVRELDIADRFNSPIVLSQDGKLVASCTDDMLSIHTTSDGRLVTRIRVKGEWRVYLLQDGQFVAVELEDRILFFRIGSTGELTQELSIPSQPAWAEPAFTPDGERLFLGGAYGETAKLREYAIPTGLELHSDSPPLEISGNLIVDPTGRYLLSIRDNQMSLYLLETHQCLWADTKLHKAYIKALVFSKDGEQFATASLDQTTAMIRTRDGALLGRLRGHQNEVWAIDASPDGQFLFTGSKDGTIKKWRWAVPPDPRRVLSEHEVLVPKVRQGDSLLTFDTASQRFSKWSGLERTSWPLSSNLPSVIAYWGLMQTGYHFDDPPKLVLLGTNHVVSFCDLSGGPIERKLDLGPGDIWGAAISNNQQWLAVIRRNSNETNAPVEVWDLSAGRFMGKLPPLDCTDANAVKSRLITFSQDSQLLAYPDERYDIVLWNLKEGREVGRFSGASWWLRHISFSENGKQLAAAGAAGVIYIWNVATGRLATPPLHGHGSGISTVTFSRDGRTLVSAGADNSVRFWSTANGLEMVRLGDCFSWDPLSESDSLLFVRRNSDVQDGGFLERIPSLGEIEAAESRSAMLPPSE